MRNAVLIVSPVGDIHSYAVLRAVERCGGNALILDSADFPQKCKLSYFTSRQELIIEPEKSGRVDARLLAGIWWRRPQAYRVTPKHPKLHDFVEQECRQAFLGALTSSAATFINPVANSRHAALKLVQLRTAEALGLRIPRTCVTTSQEEAERFYNECDRACVYKCFTGTDFGFFETRSLSDEDLPELWRGTYCPLLLQEHIRGDYDLRVTVVGDQVFPARIPLQGAPHPVDSRLGNLKPESCSIPDVLASALVAIVHRLGLKYSAIDLRFSANEGYTFFELNPEGQYLWIEIEAGLPISSALAHLLLTKSASSD
jgi:glutathione synthase/RimK-type ligase-like ATP-grasp enzyme